VRGLVYPVTTATSSFVSYHSNRIDRASEINVRNWTPDTGYRIPDTVLSQLGNDTAGLIFGSAVLFRKIFLSNHDNASEVCIHVQSEI
jgi:hypothetical protein